MFIKYFVYKYYLSMLIIYLLLMCYCFTERAPTSGPFKSSIVSVKNCSNPSKPYLKNPSLTFDASVHNTNGKNTLEGNVTVFRDTNDFKIKLRRFLYRDGKWVQSYLLNHVDCHGLLLHITLLAINVKYDKKACTFLKGFYSFKNIDVDQLQHIWASTLQFGHLMWRSEAYSKDGMYFCKEFDSLVGPA